MADNDGIEEFSTPPRNCVPNEIERLRSEVESLRREVDYLRTIIVGDGKQANPKQFKVPVEIKLPIFRDENRDSPNEFMKSFDQYCAIKQVPIEFIPILLESALKERAGIWFQVIKNEINDFEEFKSAFANEFFSVEIRTRANEAWRNRKYDSKEGSMLSFYYKQTNEISHIDPYISEYEKNYVIIGQLPKQAQMGLSGIHLSETKKLTYGISRLEDANRDRNFEGYRGGLTGFEKTCNTWGNLYNARYRADGGKGVDKREWGSFRENGQTSKRYDAIGKQKQRDETHINDRRDSWRERTEDINKFNKHGDNGQKQHYRNSNRNVGNTWRDSENARPNVNNVVNNRSMAPLNIDRNDSHISRTTDLHDSNRIEVQAEVHNLN